MRALFAALLISTAALADTSGEAKAHFEKAQTHYSLGEFEDAITEFREAYRLRHEPAILFNIAQAMRQLGQYKSAYFYYKQYVQQRPDAPNRAETDNFIAQMKKKVDADEESERQRLERDDSQPAQKQFPEDQLAEESGPTKQLPAGRAPEPRRPGVPAAAVQPATPEPKSSSGLRYAGYAVLGAGVAAEGLAFVFHGGAQTAADEFNKKYQDHTLTSADAHLKTDAESKGKLATMAALGGGVLLLTGALLSFVF